MALLPLIVHAAGIGLFAVSGLTLLSVFLIPLVTNSDEMGVWVHSEGPTSEPPTA